MKKIYFTISLAVLGLSNTYAQIGINTSNPRSTFHIDGGKDNPATGAPSLAQSNNDFVVTSAGNVGVGNSNPTNKLEITSGTQNVSGVKLTNLTSVSPTLGTGQPLAVDASGNVITIANSAAPSVVTYEVDSSSGADFNVSDLAWTIIPNSQQTVSIPAGGKSVFINFMLGIDYLALPANSGASYYTARLYIDGAPANVFQTTQERTAGAQTQYNFNTVKFLTAGSHTLDVRMSRTFNNGVASGTAMPCRPISMSFNASYLIN
ncbi:hypothetical protein SAMN05421664_0584 [Chryseobacterium soldanellicola]|uniref:Uncharacterized protein n=1 Tax=Chryseobacterium soldanellicola TaxID=311333 RepID=A0A1H0Y9P2_9FLAO|nr:hypothetical protein [Chryseobacterium soldanellicola]SDQ11868.1 hypothetical protein SAMN05421664_0584 [Chryseobacterium soldanellicola]